jgi:glutamine amidotransferase-like uncharacterized protein
MHFLFIDFVVAGDRDMSNTKTCAFLLLVLSVGLAAIPIQSVTVFESEQIDKPQAFSSVATDLTGVRVAILEGYYSPTDPRVEESRGALYHMFSWMNATIEIINSTDILHGALWAFELFVIPECLGPNMEWYLGDDALEMIRQWIRAGGSYIGVRGSFAMAVSDSYFEGRYTSFDLALINGTSYGMDDLGHTLITEVTIQNDPEGPDLSEIPGTLSVLFRTGRYLVPDEDQEIIIIANYTYNNQPALVASQYGEGNLFISSPHFEYEENSYRDGTDYMNSYDDPDSEWPLLLTISQWLIDESPTVCNTTTWTYPVTTTTTTTTITTSTTTTSTTTTNTDPTDFPLMLPLAGAAISGIVVLAIVLLVRRRV